MWTCFTDCQSQRLVQPLGSSLYAQSTLLVLLLGLRLRTLAVLLALGLYKERFLHVFLLCYAKLPNNIAVIIGVINTAQRTFMAEL